MSCPVLIYIKGELNCSTTGVYIYTRIHKRRGTRLRVTYTLRLDRKIEKRVYEVCPVFTLFLDRNSALDLQS